MKARIVGSPLVNLRFWQCSQYCKNPVLPIQKKEKNCIIEIFMNRGSNLLIGFKTSLWMPLGSLQLLLAIHFGFLLMMLISNIYGESKWHIGRTRWWNYIRVVYFYFMRVWVLEKSIFWWKNVPLPMMKKRKKEKKSQYIFFSTW